MRIRCPSCGAEVEEADQFCYVCGAELRPGVVIEAKPPPPVYAPPPPYAPMPPAPPTRPARPPVPQLIEYAGFWRRFTASFIDGLIVMFIEIVVCLFFGLLPYGLPWILGWYPWYGLWAWSWWPFWLGAVLTVLVDWLYYAGFECSSAQATPGKMALGLVVTNMDRGRISFGRATVRYFSKILSSLILAIGYIMIGLTAKKQGLHDIIAGTLVYKRGF